jgi:hypothetical protein
MSINSRVPDPARLKVVIVSCPKTGNTWLRWLVHYAYGIPIVDLPSEWSDEHARRLPESFVSHQHFWPDEKLVRWLVANSALVLTTVRHPADTLLSYFHYACWQDLSPSDPAGASLAADGDRPGRNTLRFAKHAFARAYALSMAWARLGAHVVRYEDLLQDPVRQLQQLASKSAPLKDHSARAAVFLCKPEQMTRPGLVDPRHIRTAAAGQWKRELPTEIVRAMAGMEPYKTACGSFGYSWDPTEVSAPCFDYSAVDPFRGLEFFDNGEPIGRSLAEVYLRKVDGTGRWPDPTRTDGDSFWNWLRSPADAARFAAGSAPGTFTNLMAVVYEMRPDVQAAFPDAVGTDYASYLNWVLSQGLVEMELPWGLLAPVLDAYCDQLEGRLRSAAEGAPGRGQQGGAERPYASPTPRR